MTPWSVRPSAGCSKAAARSARASILHAPSSSEYSECTWRWTADGTIRSYARGRPETGAERAANPVFAPGLACALVARAGARGGQAGDQHQQHHGGRSELDPVLGQL